MTRNDISEEILWKKSQGLTAYPEALHFMSAHAQEIIQKKADPLVWLVEHEPIFTAGTSAKKEDLFNPHHYPTYEAGRGGQWTYHGPGQRLAYVMLDLNKQNGTIPARDLRAYVQGLEQWIITTLSSLGVKSFTREGRIGVWATDPITNQEAKIAALGIRVSRWISWHGISINLNPTLNDFNGIVPCGITEYGVTSLERFDRSISMQTLDEALAKAWPLIFGSIPKEI
ncbi:lipoyl(octanoyl) transferase LipB [Swingsia samuiensis]|uniref:Octanoyltransferase n=1 Tax=Swingsia samuiensis TaxID=1293412 RepID=A0A4Y6UF47_9PROT|nr:lipoyl(octanoyl) transferase LipB [Swingsia samuiensis]QDH16169.1 lipoyl(octanoyl) transferase LipB [Swingsia samuiensis]